MNKGLLIILSVLCWLLVAHAVSFGQQAIVSAGGVATGSTGTVSYSIGQVFFKSCNGVSGSVGGFRDTLNENNFEEGNTGENDFSISEGVQQPYVIEVVFTIEEENNIALIYSVYPNPAGDFLSLKLENIADKNMAWQLLDLSGRLLQNQRIENEETTISMRGMTESVYLLKVIDYRQQKEIKVFKIIKN